VALRRADPAPDGAVAIVTGGSWDARRTLASALAGRGYAVVLAYLRDQRQAEAVVESILAARGTALAVRADVTDACDVERLFGETTAAFGRVDVVVHAQRLGASVVGEQAAHRLGEGGAIVSLCEPDAIAIAGVVERLGALRRSSSS
jgi:short-subunit dehydrogenase